MQDATKDEEEIDERQGVAVDFEEDDDGEGFVDEVREESSEDEGEDSDAEDRPELEDQALAGGAGEDRADEEAGLADGDAVIIDSGPSAAKLQQAAKQSNDIPAREIDAYWLQRQIGRLYPDAHVQHDKTMDALRVLSGEPDQPGGEEKQLREIENDLMELFDYDHHEVVQKLIENREKVVWLTKLARAENSEEREAIEREMVSEGLRWILNELHGKTAHQDPQGQDGDQDGHRRPSVFHRQQDGKDRATGGTTCRWTPAPEDDQLRESALRPRQPLDDQPQG